MPTTLDEVAQEKSTYIINFSFKNEAGDPVEPSIISWSLTDVNGTIINGRSEVSVTPATNVNITLSGDDLQILSTETAQKKVGNRNTVSRHCVVEALYNSVDYGTGLGLNGEAVFYLENLKKVT